MATAKIERDVSREIAYLTRALKAPSLRAAADRLAGRARAESCSHPEYLAACLQREAGARDSGGGEGRIRAAWFPARKSLEEFDFDHARGLKHDLTSAISVLRLGHPRPLPRQPSATGAARDTSVVMVDPGWSGGWRGRPFRHRPARVRA